MVAQAVTTNRSESLRFGPALTRLVRTVLLSAVIMLLLMALWLLVRRMGGQLRQPLGFAGLAVVAISLATLTSLLRLLWYQTGVYPQRMPSPATVLWCSPSCAVLALAMALSIQGTNALALLGFWTILLLVEGVWLWVLWRLLRSSQVVATGLLAVDATPAGSVRSNGIATVDRDDARDMGSGVCESEVDEESGEQLPDGLSQQLTRTRAEEDSDSVSGLLRARFEPSKRSHSLHVAFCPPMLRRPKVTVVQLQGPRTRIKAADVQPFGIRFDLRLVTASGLEQDVLIHFEAICSAPEVTGPSGPTA